MGLLLKQVLKTLCGVNQWCYAVFWKIGFQNSKLLIWEECYYEPNPELPFGDWEGCWASDAHSSQLKVQTGDRVYMLINKMMGNNQVNLVGQGLVGRAAFTGNHEWILANNYIGGAHPPEVLSEIHHQFSAGMQTIAVIPVCPHGVVQLGSSSTIMENLGFVNNVKSLILQLGCVPGALLSDNFGVKEATERIRVPVSLGTTDSISLHLSGNKVLNSFSLANNYNQQSVSSLPSRIAQASHSPIRQIQDTLQSTASAFHASNVTISLPKSHNSHCEPKMIATMKPNDPSRTQLDNGVVGAEVIPSNPDTWMSQHTASFSSRPAVSHQSVINQSVANNNILRLLEQQVLSDVSRQNLVDNSRNKLDSFILPQMKKIGDLTVDSHGGSSLSETQLHNGVSSLMRSSSTQLPGVGLQNLDSSGVEEVPLSSIVDQLSGSGMLSGGSCHRCNSTEVKDSKNEPNEKNEKMDDDLFQALNILSSQPNVHISLDEHFPSSVDNCPKHEIGSQSTNIAKVEYADSYAQPPSRDDLYDVLGIDFKNRLLPGKWDALLADGLCTNSQMSKDDSTLMNIQEACIDILSVSQGISDISTLYATGTDNLLDAVVSRAHSTAKQSSDDNVSCKTTLTKISNSSVLNDSPMHGLVNVSDHVKELFDLPKSMEKSGTVAPRSGCSKDEVGSCSETTSVYGSQLSSWVGHNMRRDSSVATAYSKKNDEMSKPNRKRLKPGENPRPRPKDRQMIQDRMKELREIVPNGAKCSIDALLERTIKHMLFLQSVTKHADKLKETGESKIMDKKGGLVLKDGFEGGATWAFEVGSQSMVCPIIVEDLNPPRQMLVEMLCEERGFFLEIADLIRTLGLTILKGVMEARNDKIWARFAVEANRDVTRMEVFMSLFRLLEQTVKGASSSTAALENGMIAHHPFPQGTSIPATGRPSSLQ
ncbi:transcription factor LHW [Ricinus communis]|uniref:transcription factor LHW n=1 Tax=Ricinus communis TaxID=3988 RepID=UPI00201AAFA4|nr:transcription factor LHW [Ricinus communis]